MHKKCVSLGLLIIALGLGADQLSKWYIYYIVDVPAREPVYITPFFDLVMVWNHGVSFGLLAAQNLPIFLMIMSAAIIMILIGWLFRTPSLLIAFALGCVIGGATGNVIDRLRFGAVEDFLDFHITIHHWPAFNIADSLIFIGVVLLCLDGMFKPKNLTKDPTP